MTTEIAIMNKSAIALAADSAVTVSNADKNLKTYNTANKVFALSKYAPVGIMIYGNADLTGVPWETIIKMFREYLSDQRKNKLEEYGDLFLEYLSNFSFPSGFEKLYMESVAKKILEKILFEIKCQINDSEDKLNPDKQKNILIKTINRHEKESKKNSNKTELSQAEANELWSTYNDNIESIVKKAFEKKEIDKEAISKVITTIKNTAIVGLDGESGVVIAGFGEHELFPSCVEFDIAGILYSKILLRKKECNIISLDKPADIIPFAQADDVLNFIYGIDPNLYFFLESTFSTTIKNDLPENIIKGLKDNIEIDSKKKDELDKQLKEICSGTYDRLFNELANKMRLNYIIPVFNATRFLNKSELASMAETLVNLVSFRKQVTMEAETVGGPIDVLIITKGDGPIWIKRKHYFTPELNHHFFSNYLKMEEKNGKDTDA